MDKHARLALWWPVVFGLVIGVEMMCGALVLFGPAQMTPEAAGQLTERGLRLFHPEHDLTLYAAGCVLTVFLVVGFSWLWQRRFALVADDARSDFLARHSAQLRVVTVIFLSNIVLLVVVRRWCEVAAGGFPLLPMLALAAPVLASFKIATMGSPRSPGTAARRLAGYLAAPPEIHQFPKTPVDRWLDLLVPLVLCAIIYVPACDQLAGRLFLREGLHHWDFFAMGPAVAFHHGKALGTDAYAQYGVGWPLLIDLFSGLIPITYGGILRAAAIYGCLYFVGVYAFLRLVVGRAVWATAGVLIALSLQTFHGLHATDVLWEWPSSTILRSPMDIWFFCALVLHLRSGRVLWVAVAGALLGLGVLFETDTGIYLAIVFAAYWVLTFCAAHPPPLPALRKRTQALVSLAAAAFVLLGGLAIASRGTLLRAEFWTGWLEPIISYSGGMGMIPMATAPALTWLFFTIIVVAYLGVLGLTGIKWLRRETTPVDVLLACLAIYGALTLLIFVGRSHRFNIFHPSVPFSLIAIIALARLSEAGRKADVSRGEVNGAGASKPAGWLRPRNVVGFAVVWLLATPAFLNYPGIVKTLLSAPASPEGLCLLHEPRDICGLPADAQDQIHDFDGAISSLRACIAAGQTVAVLDDGDPVFYLALGVPPWWRYSPCFPATIRRSEVAALQQAILTRGPQCVLIRGSGAEAAKFDEEDVWRAVHQTVESRYRLESTSGVFELWRRSG